MPHRTSPWFACAALLAGLTLTPLAQAAELFNNTPYTGTSQGFSPKQANHGAGQTLAFDAVATPTAVGSFGFLLNADAGTTFKFLIFAGLSQQAFAITRTTNTALTGGLFMSPEFNFTIPAGSRYSFAVVADRAFSIGYETQSRPHTQNGIFEIVGQNTNYIGFANPLYSSNGLAEVRMVLNSPVAAVPETSTALMLAAGLLAAGLSARARRAA